MRRRHISAALAVVLTAGLLTAVRAASATEVDGVPHPPQQVDPVSGMPVLVVPRKPDPAMAAAITVTPATTPVEWPAGGSADVTVPATGTAVRAAPIRAGRLPVWVGSQPASAPASVHIDLLDRSATEAAGVHGLLLRVRSSTPRPVPLTVDYTGFRNAYGGDWAARLSFRTTAGVPVPSTNDTRAGRVTAQVSATGTGTLVALDSAPAGSTGTYAATSLAPSGSWQVSTQTGDFAWAQNLPVPETPGHLAPGLALTYSSGAVDGHTASTNNQPSWVGEGWQLWPGFVERSYKGCVDDDVTPKTGDQCWATDNATLSLMGHSGALIHDASGAWRLQDDDGSRIEHLTGAANGDGGDDPDRGEYWRVTTTDGVQFYFGSRPEAQSTWTAPVFGDDAGEPCHKSTYATSWCQQAYRWQLDYVVDPHHNTITYYYAKETNNYALNMGQSVQPYVRGGTLLRAEYGTREGQTGTAPARVVFDVADRCVSGANCSLHTAQVWPDVPWDQDCPSSCPTRVAPTFWSTKRLSRITTQIWTGTAYRDVESWTLQHIFPVPGDSTGAALWLHALSHTGLVGGTLSTPDLTFTGTAMANRVNSSTDGLPPLNKYRITGVDNESGGLTAVNYAATNCSPGALPAPESNTLRCFPVRWTPDGNPTLTDWFHKYVVGQVTLIDRVGGSPNQIMAYEYQGGGAWRYDDNELIPPANRTWSQWRGYERVVVTSGDPADSANPRSATEFHYFRGMSGDHLPTGVRTATIVDSEGRSLDDADPLSGVLREQLTYNGVGGQIVDATINTPVVRGPTATRGTLKAYQVNIGTVQSRTALAGGAWRRTRLDKTFTGEGIPVQLNDLGDVADPNDDRCTTMTYARNESSWLLTLSARVTTVGVACGATPSLPGDAISDARTYYDNSTTFGAPPTAGDPTRTDQVTGYSGGTPIWKTVATATFDGYGRGLDSFDALNRKTSTAYTETGGLTTRIAVTNALGHVTTTDLEPAWGEPIAVVDANGRRTDLSRDPLGRTLGVWLPGRSKGAGDGPNLRYGYGLHADAPSWVSTETLKAGGNYVTAYALYDGFLRTRQTQTPGWGAGRVLTDTIYDSRGFLAKTNDTYYNDSAPGTALLSVEDNQIPSQTISRYDGANRLVASIFQSMNVEKWRSSTVYWGDHTDVTPPPGGTAETSYVDARGRITELRQYRDPTPTGAYDTTRYAYTKAGQLASLTDPGASVWQYTYDVRGRQVAVDDPDKGHASAAFDDAGQLLSTTDARGRTVAYTYDDLGRRTGEYDGSPSGTQLARWTYDTLLKGAPTASTRWDNGNPYTVAVVGYDAANRPTGTKVSIPTAEGRLAGNYETDLTYRPDGSPATVALPAAGNLPAETLSYDYDGLGLPMTLSGAANYVTSTLYTRIAQPTQLALGVTGNRVWQTLYYEPDTRRLSRTLVERERTTGTQVDDLNYTYDPAGNVTRIADTPAGGAVNDTQCFRYDGLRRLTDVWTATNGCAGGPSTGVLGSSDPYWTTYGYDVTGNRTAETQHSTSGGTDTTRTYTYSASGQPHALRSVTTTGPTGGRLDTYGYDASGNTTTRNLLGRTQTIGWDASGRLGSVTDAGGETGYLYDADGKRLLRKDPAAVTLYLGTQEIRLDRATGTKTGTRYYGHGGMSVAVRTGAGLMWTFSDQHGSDTVAVDSSTLAVTRRRFTPFGDTRGTAPASWPGERGFVGGTNDPTGLVQLGARAYDPSIGRFLSVDPLITTGDPQQLNPYAYATNNPATFADPSGLKQCGNDDCTLWAANGVVHDDTPAAKAARKQAATDNANVQAACHTSAGRHDGDACRTYTQNRAQHQAARAAGVSAADLEKARQIKKRNALDVALEAGGQIIMDFLGINDIKDCFGHGDVGACVSMVINIIPWTKLFKLGSIISGLRRAWDAFQNFRKEERAAEALLQKIDDAAKSCALHSFRPDTRVRMADGTEKPIAAVKLGDKVLATDPLTRKTSARAVVALHINNDHDLVDVELNGATLHTTQEHPFWVESGHQWVGAGHLRNGDVLRTPDGRLLTVTVVHRYSGAQIMRDLTVESVHSYYVVAGTDPVLVHNCGEDFIYRTGSRTDNALTDPTGVSFRNSVSSSADGAQAFKGGDKVWAVDPARLPEGSVVRDGVPHGHVSVNATPSEINNAVVPHGPDNPLDGFGMNELADPGSYRIPKK